MNIFSAVLDYELGCVSFTVVRITYIRSRTGMTARTVTAQAAGCIHPGTPEMLQLLPEEEKTDQFIVIYTDYALSTGTPEGSGASSFTAPDRINWNNRTWRVVRVRDWETFGYFQAYAVLMREGDVA